MKSLLTILCLTAMTTIGLAAEAQESRQPGTFSHSTGMWQNGSSTGISTLHALSEAKALISNFGPKPEMKGHVAQPDLGKSHHFNYISYESFWDDRRRGMYSDEHRKDDKSNVVHLNEPLWRSKNAGTTFPWLWYERPELFPERYTEWWLFEQNRVAKGLNRFPAVSRKTPDPGLPFWHFPAENKKPQNREDLLPPGDYGPWPGQF